jgi:hypothetical protein
MISLFSCSERGTSKGFHLKNIDVAEIETVEIKKNLYDTLSVQLNKLQFNKFAKIVNRDSPAELRKAIPKYWVFIRYKSDSIQLYKILDTHIGERDVYIETDEADYVKDLYEQGKKEKHKISIN